MILEFRLPANYETKGERFHNKQGTCKAHADVCPAASRSWLECPPQLPGAVSQALRAQAQIQRLAGAGSLEARQLQQSPAGSHSLGNKKATQNWVCPQLAPARRALPLALQSVQQSPAGATAWEHTMLTKTGYVLNLRRHVSATCPATCPAVSCGSDSLEHRMLTKTGYVLNLRRHVVLPHLPCNMSSNLLREPQLGKQDADKNWLCPQLAPARGALPLSLQRDQQSPAGATAWKKGC